MKGVGSVRTDEKAVRVGQRPTPLMLTYTNFCWNNEACPEVQASKHISKSHTYSPTKLVRYACAFLLSGVPTETLHYYM